MENPARFMEHSKLSALPSRLIDSLRQGRVVLLTGNGISIGGKNRDGGDIISASKLSETIAKAAGFSYKNEAIRRVFNAARPKIGDDGLSRILRDNFTGCIPSEALQNLLRFTWRRYYTFNIDDSIINTSIHRRRQSFDVFHGISARREEWREYKRLQIVFLHGRADDIDSGIIFSENDYATNSAFERPWYTRLGEDFSEYVMLMIGSSLDEPIFRQHIARFKPNSGYSGISYLVTPDDLSEIDKASFLEEGIEHIGMTADEFTAELFRLFPSGLSPEEVLKNTSLPADKTMSLSDLENLKSFAKVDGVGISKYISANQGDASKFRQLFFEGFGPNLYVVAQNEIAILSSYATNEQKILDKINTEPVLVVSGEAGAGKSTFVNWLSIRLASKQRVPVYLYNPRQVPFLDSINSLSRHTGDDRAILIVDDLGVYAREIGELVSDAKFRNLTIVTTVRSGEWASRVSRHLSDRVTLVEMPRFSSDDVPSLISKIDQFYPAPQFSRLTYEKKVERFERSRKQLLIALKEATFGEGFSEIIENEVSSITDRMLRVVLALACICTIPRVGISFAAAASVIRSIDSAYKLPTALSSLDGIVEVDQNGRLKSRHEIYAREVVDRFIDFEEYKEILYHLISYFAAFKMPVIKSVTQTDGQLFKFILNNKNIYEGYKRYGAEEDAGDLFKRFAVELQQDGHFWLQYGLLLRRLRRHKHALSTLRKALQAYPGNKFAEHALAQQKLIVATFAPKLDGHHEQLIEEAVATLMAMHNEGGMHGRTVFDDYPIVTLAYSHVNVLMKHGRVSDAIGVAKKYFIITETISGGGAGELAQLRTDLAQLVTQGRWVRLELVKGGVELERTPFKHAKHRRRGKSQSKLRRRSD